MDKSISIPNICARKTITNPLVNIVYNPARFGYEFSPKARTGNGFKTLYVFLCHILLNSVFLLILSQIKFVKGLYILSDSSSIIIIHFERWADNMGLRPKNVLALNH